MTIDDEPTNHTPADDPLRELHPDDYPRPPLFVYDSILAPPLDFERMAARLFRQGQRLPRDAGSPMLASSLGAHEVTIRMVKPACDALDWTLIDGRTGEPIADVTIDEAREFLAWLETERPLPPRVHPTMTERADAMTAAEQLAVFGPKGIGR